MRQPMPFFRNQTNSWYVQLGKKQINLGSDEKKAFDRYHDLMAQRQKEEKVVPIAGKTIYSVASGALVICLERELTLELIRAIADLKPERVVCLDEGFAGNDQLKANAVQTIRTKGITSFKTV